jgi:hypothetical protein
MANSSVSGLKLQGNAQKAASELQEKCPKIVFTSGRRDLSEQAHAMASNVVGHPDWIAKTYKASKASKCCQEWVNQNPKGSKKDIAAGLLEVLRGLGDADKARISKHLGGQAFDIAPNSADISIVKEVVKKFKGKFLDHEGKLCRWHAQFDS